MSTTEQLLESEEQEKSSNTEWRILPDRNPQGSDTYVIGDHRSGMGTLRVEEVEDDHGSYAVVYEQFVEGENDPVTAAEGEIGIQTADLPNNIFDQRSSAERYAEILTENYDRDDMVEMFNDYGVQLGRTRI